MAKFNDFTEFIHSTQEQIIKSVQDCIRIKSVSGDKQGTTAALKFFLDLGQKMGFQSKNIDDLGGIIEFGDGEKTIGIIVHLDTVPEGTGWQFPPFEGQIKDGKIYGRGAIDDKGPAIASLYALKVVKGLGIQPKNKVQMIIGIDEETVWDSTFKLLKKIKEPDFSFVPDSKFPIVIAEKGLLWLELTKKLHSQTKSAKQNKRNITRQHIIIKQMRSGNESLNIVPDYCEAILAIPEGDARRLEQKLTKFLQENKTFKIESVYNKTKSDNSSQGCEVKLLSYGKSAHAFACYEGQNAISQLMLFLNELDLLPEQKAFVQIYATKLGMEHYGEALGIHKEDELTGKLTLNPGYISLDEKQVVLRVDLRFPASQQLAKVKTQVETAFQVFEGDIKFIDSLESLSFPEDDPHIQKLLKVYRDYTGDQEAKALGMGGTTYAKAFKNAVAFGLTFPGMAKVEHQPDEYIEIDHLIKCTELYALAINELIK